MLKERIQYKDGLPVNCYVAYIEDYPIHFHDDLEVVFVLDGSIILKNGYYTYTMNSGDIFILNDREIHSYYSTDTSNTVMILQMDLTYFCKYYENLKNSFFVTDMKDADDESLEQLRIILAGIILEYQNSEPGYERKVIESTHNLIDKLISDFQYFAMEDGKFINESKSRGNKILTDRVNRITDYLYENYNRRITLKEIAEREHLSIYYLSHVIKEATGLSFQELLSFIRVEESEKLILGTNKKIGMISAESGFSAVRYFIKYFIKWFGIHPLEYRKKYTGHVISRETAARVSVTPSEQVLKMIRKQAKDAYENAIRNKASVVTTEVNVKETTCERSTEKSNTIIDLLSNEYIVPASGILELLKSLNEEQIASGRNYIITRPAVRENGLNNESFSVLFYNFSSLLSSENNEIGSHTDILNIIGQNDERLEILIKLTGLCGEYRVARYHLTREIMLSCYKTIKGETDGCDKREMMINNWRGTPLISIDTQTVSEALNIQSYLTGFSAELVLIDRIINKNTSSDCI